MSEEHEYVPLTSQVGGHPGIMTSEDGSLVIKPAMPVEVSFYQTALSDPAFTPLLPYIPNFYGTLRLEGALDHAKSTGGTVVLADNSADAIKDEYKDEYHTHRLLRRFVLTFAPTHSIVLENLSHTFLKPNILDVKLGRVLYDRSASEEKRARMEKTARETTSLKTGIRLTGFQVRAYMAAFSSRAYALQVHDIQKDKPTRIPKSYGKALKPADLPDGIAHFFPVASTEPSAAEPDTTDAQSSAEEEWGTGLPADLLLPILEAVREDVAEIRQALSQVEVRMVGASLLIIYEADWERAQEGLMFWEDKGTEEDQSEDSSDSGDSNEGDKKPSPPCTVKLIDFAHTHMMPGAGPDEGVLFGVDTVLRLLDGRIEQVRPQLIASNNALKIGQLRAGRRCITTKNAHDMIQVKSDYESEGL